MMRRGAVRALGAYYVVTGVWPLVSLRSFERVTGPKADRWLVRMVGALAIANGATLLVGAAGREISKETTSLALLSAAAFIAIDVVYVCRRRIRPIYLGDAAVEAALAAAIVKGDGRSR